MCWSSTGYNLNWRVRMSSRTSDTRSSMAKVVMRPEVMIRSTGTACHSNPTLARVLAGVASTHTPISRARATTSPATVSRRAEVMRSTATPCWMAAS
ncbi:MAG: hypothetical protein BWY85_01116 [Firmicutes bacterium ADurb.Bin506]|nr:MAG: hypothetical protein BWY85_01116 [Firmicutes bacterium ADurb.Bin506]